MSKTHLLIMVRNWKNVKFTYLQIVMTIRAIIFEKVHQAVSEENLTQNLRKRKQHHGDIFI